MLRQKEDFEGVILAAGFSSRMHAWKPGLKIAGVSLIIRTVKPMLVYCRRIVIVGGYNFEELKHIIYDGINFSSVQQKKIVLIKNENFPSGMFSSVKRGLISQEHSYGVFIIPGDIPFVKTSTYAALIDHFNSNIDCQVFIPTIKVKGGTELSNITERKGHPILIRKEIIPEIVSRSDNMSLRDVLKEFSVKYCYVDDAGIIIDLDNKEDYDKVKKANLNSDNTRPQM